MTPAQISAAATCFGVSVAGREADLAALASRAGQGAPLKAAADFCAALVRQKPQAELLAYWLADHLLARSLNWPFALPLLISAIQDPLVRAGAERTPRPGEGGWDRAVALATAKSAAAAADLAADLSHRAENLVALAPKSRAKAAKNVALRLLEQDALAASGKISGMSERGLRRLCEKLVELGAIRELTGRPTFRLYGL